MSYMNDLMARITKADKWPDFDRRDFLAVLNGMADDALLQDTLHGYLAGALIYHQLCEEILRLLLRDAEFFIQVSVLPAEIYFPEPKKVQFGRILDDLKSTIEFEHKKEIIRNSQDLNDIRINLVHRLTKQASLEDIKAQVIKMKEFFDNIFKHSQEVHDWFRLAFKGFRKDLDWQHYQSD